jgi:hypothetical protein
MTLFERLRFRLLMLWAAVRLGPSLSVIKLALRVPRIAGGAPEEGDGGDGGEPAGSGGEGEPGDGGDGEPAGGEGEEELDLDRAKAKIAKANQEAAALRKRAKEAEAKVKGFEDQNKTETEKLTEQAAANEKAASEATLEAARLRVALRKGLTETQAKRLVGETEEELEQDADDLIKDFGGGQEPDNNNGRTPRERLRPGAVPSSEPEETDPAKLAAQVPRMY